MAMVNLRYAAGAIPDFMPADLIDRHADILRLVVEGYIHTGQPVSSLYLTENFNLGISSATIRAVFADLERSGYLYAPHRSSGRIPTEKGYRFYVQSLLSEQFTTDVDQGFIQSEYLKREFRIPEILDATCHLLSHLTEYVGVVLGPEPEAAVLKHIELIDLGQDELLVIFVTRSGVVYSKTLFIEDRIPGALLYRLSRYLNHYLKGNDFNEIKRKLLEDPYADTSDREICGALNSINRHLAGSFNLVKGEDELYTAGLEKFFARIAGQNRQKLEELSELFRSQEKIRSIIKETIALDEVLVSIEGDMDETLHGLSMVAASYKMGEKRIGSIGVIGPNRMDYRKVVSLVDYIRILMSRMMTRMSN